MNPCKNCEDRHIGCHSTCKEYLRMSKERDKIRKERAKEHVIQDYMCDRSRNVHDSYVKKKKRDVYKRRGRGS